MENHINFYLLYCRIVATLDSCASGEGLSKRDIVRRAEKGR